MKNIFKFTSKLLMTALLTGLLSSVGSAGLKARTFFSADKKKSFRATLTGYYENEQKVRVRTTKGKNLSFKMEVLSKECQDYIKENADKIVVASALSVSFEEVKGEKVNGRDGRDFSYEVTFHNKSKTTIESVVVDYTIYYKKDNLRRGEKSQELTSTGTFNISEFDASYRLTETTEPIELVKKTVKKSGGG